MLLVASSEQPENNTIAMGFPQMLCIVKYTEMIKLLFVGMVQSCPVHIDFYCCNLKLHNKNTLACCIAMPYCTTCFFFFKCSPCVYLKQNSSTQGKENKYCSVALLVF